MLGRYQIIYFIYHNIAFGLAPSPWLWINFRISFILCQAEEFFLGCQQDLKRRVVCSHSLIGTTPLFVYLDAIGMMGRCQIIYFIYHNTAFGLATSPWLWMNFRISFNCCQAEEIFLGCQQDLKRRVICSHTLIGTTLLFGYLTNFSLLVSPHTVCTFGLFFHF
jgi:hypothetical protein